MRLKCLIVILCLCHSLFAQNTLLWKISRSGSNNISYLFGTYHLTGAAFIDSFPAIAEKLNASGLVVTESLINTDEIKTYYNSRPSSDTLSQLLSKEQMQWLQEALNNKYDASRLSAGELYVLLSAAYQRRVCRGGRKDSLPADLYIQQLAQRNGKEQFYLEKNQPEILRQSSAAITWNIFKRQAPGLLEKYRAGTYDANACLMSVEYTTLEPKYNFRQPCPSAIPLEERNRSWMQEMIPLLTAKNCFIAVGYQHLLYKCGLIQQLIKAGYSVEPVDMK